MFGGYFYNPLTLVRLMGARVPGASPDMIDKAFFDERDDVPPYEAADWHESERHAAKLTASTEWVMSTDAITRVDDEKVLADRIRAERPDLGATWDGALLARARSLVPIVQMMFDTSISCSLGASVGPGALGAICEELGEPGLAVTLLGGIEVDSSQTVVRHVGAVPPGGPVDDGDGRLRGRTGRRPRPPRRDRRRRPAPSWTASRRSSPTSARGGPTSGTCGPRCGRPTPSWRWWPSTACGWPATTPRPSPATTAAVAEQRRAADDVRGRLADDAEALATFEAALSSSAIFLAGRERYKTNIIKVIHEIRMAVGELARRTVDASHLDHPWQVFMCTADELDVLRFEPETLTERLRQREADFLELFDLVPPYVVHETVPPLSAWERRTGRQSGGGRAPATCCTGTGGSSGQATGPARVITDPSDPGALQPGDVLVAPNTDPSWTPLFVPAAAVVVDIGAMGSHAMIISREMGIPCVVSVENATARIPDGATVTVDGNAGTVTLH